MPGSAPIFQLDAPAEGLWRTFLDPVEELHAHRLEDVPPLLRRVEQATDEGLHAAGFLTYEAAPAFDASLCTHASGPLPLAWFGLYRRCEDLAALPAEPPGTPDAAGPLRFVGGGSPDPPQLRGGGSPAPPPFRAQPWQPNVSREQYDQAIGRIKRYIAAGDTYQVNYTIRLHAACIGQPWELFRRLGETGHTRLAAWLDIGSHVICSLSPELFLRLDGRRLVTRPMKGTSLRGLDFDDDARRREELRASPKDRAENAMIVDMARNDLGRVARPGSVRVDSAFDIEPYPTLHQMTSTVSAETDAGLLDILRATFPAASITGAPKVRTMQIIRELEAGPRGLYCGAIGFCSPGRRAQFNVAIRTLVLDKALEQAEYGVGGGIVWDSTERGEYAECLAKAAVLTAGTPTFDLLESLGWQSGEGYLFLEEHLERLERSAGYFQFRWDVPLVRRRLAEIAAGLGAGRHKVRLLVSRDGSVRVEAQAVVLPTRPWRLALAERPVDPGDCFLYHKTTHRECYARAGGARQDADDVLLFNPRGELTETLIGNVVLQLAGVKCTPPVSAGLLPGVFRRHLLATGQAAERTLTVADARLAERIWVVNSVRGWLVAELKSH